MKKIQDVLNGLEYNILNIVENESNMDFLNIDIEGIVFDSRRVKNNYLFVAEKGDLTDGHLYIDKAIINGAKVIVFDSKQWMENNKHIISKNIVKTEDFRETLFIKVENSSLALAQIAKNFYDNPSSKLNLVGITGTNGKTTTVTLLYELFTKMGYKCGKISTVENAIVDKILPTERTTPDSITLNDLLYRMVGRGCEYVFMEVSSHSVVQNRIAGLRFVGAIFSNITLDHLDYHKTFAAYIRAKKKFFDNLPKMAFALTNIDDKNGEVMLQNTKAKRYFYSLESAKADFRAKILESSFEGLDLLLNNKEVFVQMVGRFNAYNLLAVYSTAILLGADRMEILKNMSLLKAAKGRFEIYKLKSGAYGIIDYAHTPDAIENVLNTINDCRGTLAQKIITVIGCGGNRDKTKRPLMAEISFKLSDILILTSDNPRNENPQDIIKEMEQGLINLQDSQDKQTFSIENRREAIKVAMALAKKDDIILVAGKGHENYQEICGEKYHFDDREELMKGM
ncbi:MAG: UDP-N-acetylmuramoyl-L-alanyl-D-glutamate--2,6-diaminopimelate ligase [Bacteroidales bacterium]